jgi:hypothetical protein
MNVFDVSSAAMLPPACREGSGAACSCSSFTCQPLSVALKGTVNGQGKAAASQAHEQHFDNWNNGLTTAGTTLDAPTA